MVASLVCPLCREFALPGLEGGPPLHCRGQADHPPPPGVLGGVRCSCWCRDAGQDAIAGHLYDERGGAPWPNCG